MDSSVIAKYLLPHILPVLLAEFAVIVLLISAIFVKERKRKICLGTSLVLVTGLVIFYFTIPLMPVHFSPNHPDPEWDSGKVVHILPTVSESRILLKTSFTEPLKSPSLTVDGTRDVPGEQMDTEGYFWAFDVPGLESDTTYDLQLLDFEGQPLCDAWPLGTFPSPESEPDHLRVVAFTGSGGHDACRSWFGTGQIPVSIRQQLLNRALSFSPDVLLGSGDQIYYDIKYGVSPQSMGKSRRAVHHNGDFDESMAVMGTSNEEVLKNAVGPQIAYLFGTSCRSIPTYFIADDHDYFVNDEARESDSWDWKPLVAWQSPFVEGGISLPPEDFLLELGRSAYKLYLPEFLPDETRPQSLPGTGAEDRPEGVSECFGTFRYGDLVEGLMYDTRRYITLTGADAVFIPPSAEQWIIDRTEAEDASYLVHFSPISFGWSAGKWLEWYPDIRVKGDEGPYLTTEKEKYMWQEGWFEQHNRILEAAGSMQSSQPLFVCGDMHTQTAGWIERSGELDLTDDPIPSVLTGSMSVDKGGFPSGGLRGIEAQPPTMLTVDEELPSYEKAGFTIIDFTPEKVTVQFFGWKHGEDSLDEMAVLEPHFTFEVVR